MCLPRGAKPPDACFPSPSSLRPSGLVHPLDGGEFGGAIMKTSTAVPWRAVPSLREIIPAIVGANGCRERFSKDSVGGVTGWIVSCFHAAVDEARFWLDRGWRFQAWETLAVVHPRCCRLAPKPAACYRPCFRDAGKPPLSRTERAYS